MINWIKLNSQDAIDLGDWGIFIPCQSAEFIENADETDRWMSIKGTWIPAGTGSPQKAKLEIFTQLDGEPVPEYMFYFQVLDLEDNLLTGNL